MDETLTESSINELLPIVVVPKCSKSMLCTMGRNRQWKVAVFIDNALKLMKMRLINTRYCCSAIVSVLAFSTYKAYLETILFVWLLWKSGNVLNLESSWIRSLPVTVNILVEFIIQSFHPIQREAHLKWLGKAFSHSFVLYRIKQLQGANARTLTKEGEHWSTAVLLTTEQTVPQV